MITPGRSWAQYNFYKYIACTLQTTSKQVEIPNRLLRPCVSFLYAKRHREMNATSAIIAARDLVRPPPCRSYYSIRKSGKDQTLRTVPPTLLDHVRRAVVSFPNPTTPSRKARATRPSLCLCSHLCVSRLHDYTPPLF